MAWWEVALIGGLSCLLYFGIGYCVVGGPPKIETDMFKWQMVKPLSPDKQNNPNQYRWIDLA